MFFFPSVQLQNRMLWKYHFYGYTNSQNIQLKYQPNIQCAVPWWCTIHIMILVSQNHRPPQWLKRTTYEPTKNGDVHRGATHGELHHAVAHTVAVHGAAGDQLQGLKNTEKWKPTKMEYWNIWNINEYIGISMNIMFILVIYSYYMYLIIQLYKYVYIYDIYIYISCWMHECVKGCIYITQRVRYVCIYLHIFSL